LSRHAPRHPCFGGSPLPADPLVAEITSGPMQAAMPVQAARSNVVPSVASLPFEPQAEDGREIDDLEGLDQQLLEALASDAAHSEDAARDESVLEILRAVRLPTVQALRTGSLRSLRSAIVRKKDQADPDRWAAYHLILATALRLRAYRTYGHRRAQLLIGAARAFDVAFSIYATLRGDMLEPPEAATDPSVSGESDVASADLARCGSAYRPIGSCLSERDGTVLVARVIAGPFGANRHLLERAITYLRMTRSSADIKSWAWVSSTNNLACALNLLGTRTPTPSGSAMLREAAQVLHECLLAHAAGHRREERASTLINLAETLLSIAERETPLVRLRKIERALTATIVALLDVVPPEWAWLLRVERAEPV
jgi:hypothetical protein